MSNLPHDNSTSVKKQSSHLFNILSRLQGEAFDLDALVPDPQVSDRQYDQFFHLDIPSLEDTEVIDELHALQPLLWGLSDCHWLRERVARLEAEVTKRRGDSSHGFRNQLEPKLARGRRQ